MASEGGKVASKQKSMCSKRDAEEQSNSDSSTDESERDESDSEEVEDGMVR